MIERPKMKTSDPATRVFALALFAATMGLPMALPANPAKAAALIGDYLGKTQAEIAQSLQQRGYKIEEFEVEGGLIEVEATLDGQEDEIHVDPRTGKIVRIEADD
jgi:hypothetical protein